MSIFRFSLGQLAAPDATFAFRGPGGRGAFGGRACRLPSGEDGAGAGGAVPPADQLLGGAAASAEM